MVLGLSTIIYHFPKVLLLPADKLNVTRGRIHKVKTKLPGQIPISLLGVPMSTLQPKKRSVGRPRKTDNKKFAAVTVWVDEETVTQIDDAVKSTGAGSRANLLRNLLNAVIGAAKGSK